MNPNVTLKNSTPFGKTLHIQDKTQRHQRAVVALFFRSGVVGLGAIFSGTFKKRIRQIVKNNPFIGLLSLTGDNALWPLIATDTL